MKADVVGQLAVEHPELLNEWDYEKNGDLRPEDITSGSNKKVWWKCDKGHEWQTTIYSRSSGSSCPVCSGKKALAGLNDLATLRPDLAKEWHPTKNGDLTPDKVMPGSRKKVWWKCDKGHEWQARVNDRNRGNGCPYCSGKKVLPGFNDLATTNPDLAFQWHPTKNGDLTPKDVTAGSKKKVWWKCDKGHEWQATIESRNSGNGCPVCAGKQVLVGFNDLATVRPEIAIQWHPTKNRDLTPKDVTIGNKKKVWWKCDKGHEWQATTNNRCSGYGCPVCSGELQTSFAEQAILYYLSLITSVESRFKVSDKYEVDIFLPELNTAIEYDGWYWHKRKNKQERDKDKSAYINEAGIRLIRVKEVARKEELPPDEQDVIYCAPTQNGEFLGSVLNKLVQRIGIPNFIDVNIKRDSTLIHNQYIKGSKANSLIALRPDLAAQWHPTKNGDLTPDKVVPGSKKKAWWICDKGHEWQATIGGRNNGSGCPYCSGKKVLTGFNDLATVNQKLAAQWHPIKNKNLTPESVTVSSDKKVWWKCDKGHEWQATVKSRNKGSGCPYCSGNKVLPGFNDLATTNPDLAAQWHPTKNGNLTPKDVSISSTKKVWWKCDKGHEWQATVASRNAGRACPVCAGKQVLVGFNDLATVRPDLAAQWNSTKNVDLTPDDVTVSSGKKAWWICDKGHEWQATVASRNAGRACPFCSGNKVLPGFNDLVTTNPDLAAQWHPTKNGDLTPKDVTAGSTKKAWWICDKGHEWQATIGSRNSGNGCPYCSGRQAIRGVNDLETLRPELAAQWHPTKNSDLTPQDVTPGSSRKVWWICDKGHEWQAVIAKRSNGRGCPVCRKKRRCKDI